jgi:hypothetical protein
VLRPGVLLPLLGLALLSLVPVLWRRFSPRKDADRKDADRKDAGP